jgi:hypothetical protein
MDMPENDAESLNTSITAIQESFKKIDTAVDEANSSLGDSKLDDTWVKAIFFAIFFENHQPTDDFYNNFVNCFITTETIDGVQASVPLTDKNVLLSRLNNDLNLSVSNETINEADEVYSEIKDDALS